MRPTDQSGPTWLQTAGSQVIIANPTEDLQSRLIQQFPQALQRQHSMLNSRLKTQPGQPPMQAFCFQCTTSTWCAKAMNTYRVQLQRTGPLQISGKMSPQPRKACPAEPLCEPTRLKPKQFPLRRPPQPAAARGDAALRGSTCSAAQRDFSRLPSGSWSSPHSPLE